MVATARVVTKLGCLPTYSSRALCDTTATAPAIHVCRASRDSDAARMKRT
jgi:hypothetical protein